MNTTALTADDLKRFCSQDDSRPQICRLFSQEQWTYATDGRILIRVPRLADVPEYDDSPKDIQKKIFDEQPIKGKWMPVPADLPEFKAAEKCHQCKGFGCDYCDGSGFLDAMSIAVKVGKHSVSHIYLHKLKMLPNVEICESAKDDLHGLGVRFDGGEGRLMPMRVQ